MAIHLKREYTDAMKVDRRKRKSNAEQNYRTLVESIKDYAIFMLDKKGKITSWDQGGAKLFGFTRAEIIGKNFSILYTKEDIRRGCPASDIKNALSEGRYLDERQYVRKNKTTFWSSGVLTSIRNKYGVNQGFSKIMRDVSQQNDLHVQAVHNSTHDFLTGLPNRNFFEEHFLEAIKQTKKGSLLAILYLDFNNFKRTNDEEGHRFGDLVLIEIANRLGHAVRVSDVAARFGGDEFVILAKQLANKNVAIRIAKKIVQTFDAPIIIEKRIIKTSVSIGVALYPTDGKKPADLLRLSDVALYQAKKQGGNQFQFWGKSLTFKKR